MNRPKRKLPVGEAFSLVTLFHQDLLAVLDDNALVIAFTHLQPLAAEVVDRCIRLVGAYSPDAVWIVAPRQLHLHLQPEESERCRAVTVIKAIWAL